MLARQRAHRVFERFGAQRQPTEHGSVLVAPPNKPAAAQGGDLCLVLVW
jgi:hypothetical protein